MTSQVTVAWDNVRAFKAALEKTVMEVDKSSRAGLISLLAITEAEAKKNFRGSHSRGTPHVGGAQPNIITGNLRRSITHSQPIVIGLGTLMARAWPNAVYARSVEMGNPEAHSGAYPYFAPAVRAMRLRINEVMADAWSKNI